MREEELSDGIRKTGPGADGAQHDQHDDRISSNSSATSELTSSSAGQDDRSKILRHKRAPNPARPSIFDGERILNQLKQSDSGQKRRLASRAMRDRAQAAKPSTIVGGGSGPPEERAGPNEPGLPHMTAVDKSSRLLLALFLIGLIVCVTSIGCILLLPSLISNQIAKKLVLKNNSMLLERWSKPNVPMYFKVWLYDIKNAQEIIDKRGTKPRVEEIGPFVFNLRRQKDVISFAGDNLYYTERKVFHFNRRLSCCAINTTVTIPNIPLVAVVDRALGYNLPLLGRFIPRLINRAIQSLREQLFVRKQVREILFDGYDVELLKMVSRIGSLVGLPQQSQKFALLKGRNDTWRPDQDGVWAINTGQRDRRQFGKVASWNSYKKLPFWPAPQCNVINGSDGTLFPPPIKRTEPLYIFNQELCRTVNLVFDGPSDVRSIQSLRFVLNPLNFAHTMTAQTPEVAAPVSLPAAALSRLAAAQQRANQTPRPRIASLLQSPRPVQPLQVVSARRNPANSEPVAALQAPPQQLSAPQARQPATRRTSSGGLSAEASGRRFIRSEPTLKPATDELKQTTTTPTNKETAEATIRSQQEKLIRAAQEAQLANERKSKLNPQTCFCDRKTTNLNGVNVCEFDGLIDLSKCSKQAQVVFGSMPHFYNSDPRLLDQVVGMAPNASRHTTYLDIEPNTGLVLGGKRRVQLNVIIKHNNEIDGFENINDMLVPVVWFEESALIPEESAQKFRSMYVDKIRMINLILFSLLSASIVLLAVDARLLVTTRRWREFKLRRLGAHPAQDGRAGQPKDGPADYAGSKSSRHFRVPSASGQAGDGRSRPSRLAGARPAAHKSVNSPLLQSTSSATNTSAGSSPSVTPPGSPQDSPELRKWSPGRTLTRVHLNSATDDAERQSQSQSQTVQVEAATEKSIIKLGGQRRSSPPSSD